MFVLHHIYSLKIAGMIRIENRKVEELRGKEALHRLVLTIEQSCEHQQHDQVCLKRHFAHFGASRQVPVPLK